MATRADTGEVLHARMRNGSASTGRGTKRFIEELIARVRRAGAASEIVVPFDSGFWSNRTIEVLGRLDVRYTMAVRTNNAAVARAIAAIEEPAWADIDYTPDGVAQVAECRYKAWRLIVRRTRLTDTARARLWPNWRHHGFLPDLDGDAVTVDDLPPSPRRGGAGHPRPQGGRRARAPALRALLQRRLAVLCGATTSSAGPPRWDSPGRPVN